MWLRGFFLDLASIKIPSLVTENLHSVLHTCLIAVTDQLTALSNSLVVKPNKLIAESN
jgi:hypothetical protein